MRIIPTKIHGVLDYVTALTAVALPRLLNWSNPVTFLLTILGVGMLAYTLITQFELGVVKILPVTWHLALDGVGGVLLLTAALLLVDAGAGERIGLVAMGALELIVTMLTKTTPDHVSQTT